MKDYKNKIVKIGFNQWMVIEDIHVKIARLKTTLIIPCGFVCDLYTWVPNLDPLAAVVHDFLYKNKEINGIKISQKMADRIFLDLMRHSGGWTKVFSKLYYSGVRAFGWMFY